MTKKKLQVVRIQCGGNGQTVYLDNQTNLLYNIEGSIVAQDSFSKSCNILPIKLEYIEIDIKDEENPNSGVEIPPVVSAVSGDELPRHGAKSTREIQSEGVLRDASDISRGVAGVVKPSDTKVGSREISTPVSPRPARRTTKT